MIKNSFNEKNLGTLGWRAKEVILKNKYSTKSDIFSLGCCLYFYITGG
jgi:serine/threonine protein kinase